MKPFRIASKNNANAIAEKLAENGCIVALVYDGRHYYLFVSIA